MPKLLKRLWLSLRLLGALILLLPLVALPAWEIALLLALIARALGPLHPLLLL